MTRRNAVLAIAALALLAAIALQADNYVLRLATMFGMYATLAMAWNIIGGFAGYPSFATAAFFGLGAYATGVAQTNGVPLVLAWACAGLVAAGFAALLGSAILHLRGRYFAIASLVVADVLRELTNSWTDVTGGGMGMNLPLIGGAVVDDAYVYLAAMLVLAAATFATSFWLDRSKLGVALRCIAQNEDAAQIIGIDTRRAKTIALVLSSLFAGLAGGAYASWVTYIDPTDVYDGALSVKPILMALLGGVGTVSGPVLGAFVYLGLEELLWRNLLDFHAGILGLLVVLLVLFLPGGLRQLRGQSLVGWLKARVAR